MPFPKEASNSFVISAPKIVYEPRTATRPDAPIPREGFGMKVERVGSKTMNEYKSIASFHFSQAHQ